ALIAGGHTFGKTHGAASADHVDLDPESAGLEEQGCGWSNRYGTGKGSDTITSGLEVTWTTTPAQWSNNFFENLFGFEWELSKSPAGAHQWVAKNAEPIIPDAHDPSKKHLPTMLTTDLSLRFDPAYEKVSRHFLENPEAFADAFARAWFKLTHRDLGPRSRYLGPEVPSEELIWQDPLPKAPLTTLTQAEYSALRANILASGLTVAELVETAWASASTFRGSDKRGGANGARIRLEPQRHWEVNKPSQLEKVLGVLGRIQEEFNATGDYISLADLIVFAGNVAIEKAAHEAGYVVEIPFTPGRTDATQEQTDVESFAVLEPVADGFRNFHRAELGAVAEALLIDKAQLLTLTAPELTVLVGGFRALGIGSGNHFANANGALGNDFFVKLLDMGTAWKPTTETKDYFEGRDRATGEFKGTATRVDLVFGSNSILRALAEVYACADAKEKFVTDFIHAWTKVMNLDRFDASK
ncbi:MAG TPA: peroxidase family protein, partial [Fimbriimonas sp.]|nr:peroxidase family protein [Fimbriimonas sp.]